MNRLVRMRVCIVRAFFEAQASVSHVCQPTRKVGRRPRHSCYGGIGYAEDAGADCLGAGGDQRTTARTGTPHGRFSTTSSRAAIPKTKLQDSDGQIRHLLDVIRESALFLSKPAPPTTWRCYEGFLRWRRVLLRRGDVAPPALLDLT